MADHHYGKGRGRPAVLAQEAAWSCIGTNGPVITACIAWPKSQSVRSSNQWEFLLAERYTYIPSAVIYLTAKPEGLLLNTRIVGVAAAAALALISGCASITDGTSQTIIFKLDPADTRCVATRDGDGELGSIKGSTASLNVSKDKDDIVVSCSAAGREPKIQRVASKTQAAGVAGGFFLDLGITDMITGAMWKYPSEVSIVLDGIPTAADGAAAAKAAATATTAVSAAAPPTAVLPSAAPVSGGRELFQVTKLGRESNCNPDPKPTLTASGPAHESYVVPCLNGDALMVRCEMSNCRTLR